MGSWLYGPLVPVWNSFQRLSRGRPYTGMGHPLPIPYRDIADELRRCSWPYKTQLERWLLLLDSEFLELANEKAEEVPIKKVV